MAKGFGFANKTRNERKARSGGSSAFSGKLVFKLPDDGDTGTVRFVEDEDGEIVNGCYVHDVPVEGRPYPDMVTCIAQDDEGNDTDDPCPGCEKDLKRKERFFVQVVWYEAPVYKTDENNRPVKDNTGDLVVKGYEDQLAVWPMGPQLEEQLEEIEEEYGLLSTPFVIKRKGQKLKTTYRIKPEDPKNPEQEIDDETQALIEEKAYDMTEFTKPPSFEEFESRINGKAFNKDGDDSDNGKASKASRRAKKSNPFGGGGGKKRKRRLREEDDDEDED